MDQREIALDRVEHAYADGKMTQKEYHDFWDNTEPARCRGPRIEPRVFEPLRLLAPWAAVAIAAGGAFLLIRLITGEN